MKNLRQFCAASVLTLTLTLPAFAGEISTMVTSPPPPTTQGEISTTVTDGDIHTMATGVMLNLLQSVLSLF